MKMRSSCTTLRGVSLFQTAEGLTGVCLGGSQVTYFSLCHVRLATRFQLYFPTVDT